MQTIQVDDPNHGDLALQARQCGTALAASLGYVYPLEDDVRIVDYLEQVRALPQDAAAYDAVVPTGEQSRGGRAEAGHAL